MAEISRPGDVILDAEHAVDLVIGAGRPANETAPEIKTVIDREAEAFIGRIRSFLRRQTPPPSSA
jgi:hypothetical protein